MIFFSGIWFSIKLFFAGLFPEVVDVLFLSAAILLCIVAEFAAGWAEGMVPWLEKPLVWIQKHILIIAMILGGVVVGEYRGAKHEADKCAARAAIVQSHVDGVVHDAETKVPTSKDKFETPQ